MKCDCCQREATVHEVQIRSGVRVERHLCEVCATSAGLLQTGQLPAPITELLSQFSLLPHPPAPTPGPTKAILRPPPDTCPTCGMTFAQFRQAERLGCADCYAALERHLGPLLERVNEGANQHLGKVPARLHDRTATPTPTPAPAAATIATPIPTPIPAPGPTRAELEARITHLRKALDAAVTAERYEHAAKLRDELARLAALMGG